MVTYPPTPDVVYTKMWDISTPLNENTGGYLRAMSQNTFYLRIVGSSGGASFGWVVFNWGCRRYHSGLSMYIPFDTNFDEVATGVKAIVTGAVIGANGLSGGFGQFRNTTSQHVRYFMSSRWNHRKDASFTMSMWVRWVSIPPDITSAPLISNKEWTPNGRGYTLALYSNYPARPDDGDYQYNIADGTNRFEYVHNQRTQWWNSEWHMITVVCHCRVYIMM